jgi:hypothetical protein
MLVTLLSLISHDGLNMIACSASACTDTQVLGVVVSSMSGARSINLRCVTRVTIPF